jgi:peptidoglycan/LPS O-acetylase OafA/YrhL
MTIGFALIVIQGRTGPVDVCLNFAGMLAPVVAVVPTTDVGVCWSRAPSSVPVNTDGTLADWVIANIDNNMLALLIAGIGGLLVAAAIAHIGGQSKFRWGLAITLAFLLLAGLAFRYWDDFYTRAHGFAALGMFAFLAAAVALNAWELRGDPDKRPYFLTYIVIAVLMVAVPVVFFPFDFDHSVLVVEAVEIVLVGLFWLLQTKEHWIEGAAEPDWMERT